MRTHPTAPAAWLVDLAPEGVGDDVCAYHADSLRPADGWMLHDTRRRNTRRTRVPTVGATRSRPLPPAPPRLADLDLRRPSEPESLDDLLTANSPLLARAFAKSR